MARIIKFWQDLQSSYYFIPGLMALAAIVLATITSNIDRNFDYAIMQKMGWFYSNKADGARSILSTIAGSMITVAGVTFSMTMVAVSSAAAQYGPRLIGNFMRDRANQFTLGTFTATFVYCLMILRVARTGDVGTGANAIAEFVPNISLLVALILTLASVGVLIFFIHHIPETLNVGNITANVGRELNNNIDEIFPKNTGQKLANSDESKDEYLIENSIPICAISEGYLQTIDHSTLMRIACKNDIVVRLQYMPGDFVVSGNKLANIWSSEDELEDLNNQIQSCFALGRERTVHQNILFLVDELVEILARALSPGVNDPFTAINCMNWLHSSLCKMIESDSPSPYRYDENEALRIIAHPVSFKDFADAIFNQSRTYVASDRNAIMHMISVLAEALVKTKTNKQKEVLKSHLDQLHSAAMEMLNTEVDRSEVTRRYKQCLELLSEEKTYLQAQTNQAWLGGSG